MITLDTTAHGHASAASLTFSHITGTLTNGLLVVSISSQDSNFNNLPITGVTYNGVALTNARSDHPVTNGVSAEIWYLLAPPSGTHSVVVTATGSVEILAVSSTWSGVKQSAQPDAVAGSGGADHNSSAPSTSITTVADNSLVVEVVSSEANQTALGSGQTIIAVDQDQSFQNVSTSYVLKTPAGSQTMSETLAFGAPWEQAVASFAPAAGSSAPTVTTQAASSIAATSATGNGNVTSDGGATVTERGFVLSTSANPTTSDTKFTAAGTTGAYTGSMTSLIASTAYHYRAYAINSVGTSYGADTTFTTSAVGTGGGTGFNQSSGSYDERLGIQRKTGIIGIPYTYDLRTAFYGGKVSQNDAIRAYLQSVTGLTTVQSLSDLWRQFFIGKGVTNQVSLSDMAKDFFRYTGF